MWWDRRAQTPSCTAQRFCRNPRGFVVNSSLGDGASGRAGGCGGGWCFHWVAAKTVAAEGAAGSGGDFPRVHLFPWDFRAAEMCCAGAEGLARCWHRAVRGHREPKNRRAQCWNIGLVATACLWVCLRFGGLISGCHRIPVHSLIARLAPYGYFKDTSSVKNWHTGRAFVALVPFLISCGWSQPGSCLLVGSGAGRETRIRVSWGIGREEGTLGAPSAPSSPPP